MRFDASLRSQLRKPSEFSASIQWLFLVLILVVWPLPAPAQDVGDVRTGVVKVISRAEGQQQRTGTGFIVRLDSGSAYVVTASHVVEGDAQPMVSFFDVPNQLVPTKVIGLDPTDPKGLAVLVSKNAPDSARTLPIDTASDYRGGTPAVVVGFPLTHGTGWSVIPATVDGLKGRDLVLTAPLESGDSGGPILIAGKVVGAVVETRGQFGLGVPAAIVQLSLQGWGVFSSANAPEKGASAAPPRTPVKPGAKPESEPLRPQVEVNTLIHNERMEVLAMAASADGSAVLMGGEEFHRNDGSYFGRASLTFWDLRSGRMVASPPDKEVFPDSEVWAERVDRLALSKDGSRAIVKGRQNFLLYDPRAGTVIRKFSLMDELHAYIRLHPNDRREGCWGQNWAPVALALSGDGKRALTTDEGCMLKLWDAEAGKVVWSVGMPGPIETVAFAPDERFVLSGGKSGWDGKGDSAEYSGYPSLRDAHTGRLIRGFTADSPAVAETVSVAFSPDGRFAVSHTKPKGILLWDVASGNLLGVLIGQAKISDTRDNYSLQLSHDGRYLLAGCFVYDLYSRSTTEMRRGLSHFQQCAGPLASLAGGNYAVYPGGDIFEFTTGKRVASLVNLGDGEWMTITSESYYVASEAGEKRLGVRAGGAQLPIDGFRSTFSKPDEVKRSLAPLVRRP